MSNNSKYSILGVDLSAVRNKMEHKVIIIMKKVLASHQEHDLCSMCIEDAFALSLNRLPSKYVQHGSIVLNTEYPDSEEIYKIVFDSVTDVAQNPRHKK